MFLSGRLDNFINVNLVFQLGGNNEALVRFLIVLSPQHLE
ncbi:hypothetical protein SLEP1_g15027 [Rubroshorea leprosula]|uniref:Uncharacterized protein n=1 Tax=Rubroshorea leprosula TaxID=152421 RepID=A0AAV5IVH5_9ROSI|nr:hypothetical protein SLEP1_g15027 [Rubroshorea leprosula]